MEIGEKIKMLRLQRGLTQEELADRCELSKGFISQVERDLTSPSIATLIDILSSLGTDAASFFSETKEEKVVFTDADICVKEDADELKGFIRWLVPTAQKNSMEPILVKMEPGGTTAEQDPHEGEEFGYVLSGTVTVHLGERTFRARKDESFYFKPTENHYLANHSGTACKVIWISTPPSF